ncbi:NAD-dependent epimerase/dehydratase family protein [Bacillus sp. DJP31]|uniref:NAD-dependent epimerase/dehydratase family protein n=1 Tax=Bacillus sp. DJP31 TaxID=3409789 RepID=UPI003BB6D462
MDRKPQLLITGASGFTGIHACTHFSNLNYEVTAVSRGHVNQQPQSIRTECCELSNKDEVNLLIQKVKPDYLLHLAGQNHVDRSWNDPIATIESNLLSTLYVVEAIRTLNLTCKIVIAGSALQFDPSNLSTLHHPYSLSKTLQVLIAQAWEKLYKMDIVIAKTTNLIGPGPSNGVCSIFASKIVKMENGKSESYLDVSNVNTTRDFLDVRDAVRAYEILFQRGRSGEIYQICSGKYRSLEVILDKLKSLSAIDLKVNSQSNHMDQTLHAIQPKSLAKLGWSQKYDIEQSLIDTLNYYRYNEKKIEKENGYSDV